MKRIYPWIILVVLAAAALACDINNPPAWTPSPPQMTAGALNATYEAWATQTAAAPSPTPSLTPTPTVTLTSSIVEVSATRAIIEVTP